MDKASLVYLIIGALVVLLYTEWLRPSVSFLLMAVALIVCDIVPANEVLKGFANEQLAVIIMLLIISSMISNSGVMDRAFSFMNKDGKTRPRLFLLKMTGVVGTSSAIFNNTPLVALFMPYVHSWCGRHGRSPSKFLIPLSYASILGGCMTLVGTSTNLIVNGLAVDNGLPSLEIFDFLLVGGVMMVLGLIYLLTIGFYMLPENSTVQQDASIESRQYFLETIIKPDSSLIGKTVENAKLRSLEGLFLIEIMRGEQSIAPVSPKEELQEEDVLFFAGDPKSIKDLTDPRLGLSLPKACNIPLERQEQLVEAVVAHNSRLVGKKVQDSDFRARYDSAILAIHRNGERLWGKIGEVEIKAGDLLLLLTGKDFYSRTKNNPGFYILNTHAADEDKTFNWKGMLLILGLVTALALNFCDISLFKSLAVVLGLAVLVNVSSPTQIRNSIDFNLLLIIAFGLSLGQAMVHSGAAEQLTELSGLTKLNSPVVLFGALFIATNILASFITSKAAVAITIPIAIQILSQSSIPFEPLILSIAFGGAANFLTPIGYQTNLMVYGPGRYRFTDFFKIGLPLTLVYCAVSSVLLAWSYNLL